MVKIRLARRGRKKLAVYDVVVADARAPRDGRFIEKLGTYNPLTVPASVNINNDRAFNWLMNGAQPTDTVREILSYRGIMLRKHLQIGVIKGALTQEEADRKLQDWLNAKEEKTQSSLSKLTASQQAAAQARKEAETKVREAREEALRKKAEAAAAAEQGEAAAEEGATGEAATEEAAADEAQPAAESTGEAAPEASAEQPAPEAQPEAGAEGEGEAKAE